MRIPIYVSRVPRVQQLPSVQTHCNSCGTVTNQRVERRYFSVHVYFIPMLSGGTQYVYQCLRCSHWTAGPRPPGSPGKPFLHAFGMAVFLGLPIIIAIGTCAWQVHEQKAAAEDYRAAEKRREEQSVAVKARSKTAYDAVVAAERECDAKVAELMKAAPKKPLDLKTQKPVDASVLVGASYFATPKALSDYYIPIPDGKYFGKQACFVRVSQELENAAKYESVPPSESGRKAVLAEADQLEHDAKALAAPKTVVLTDLACPENKKGDTCGGVAVWLTVDGKAPLAVARVHAPHTFHGDVDQPALAAELARLTADW